MAKECHKQFSVKTGSVFEDSPIPLDKWLIAVWLVVNCKNGISHYEIMRDSEGHSEVGMVHAASDSPCAREWQLGARWAAMAALSRVDETFIGGKPKQDAQTAGADRRSERRSRLDRGKDCRHGDAGPGCAQGPRRSFPT